MKKIMILAVAAVACIAANASSIKWSTTAAYQSGTSTLLTGAAAYLIDANVLSQSDILTSMRGGKTLADVIGSDYVLKSATAADGKVAALIGATDVYAGGSSQKFFTVLANADESEVFFTTTGTKTIAGTGDTTVSGVLTASKNAAFDVDTAYSTAGWYTTQSIPEPTSGLLMLLGMAGLALRRRRA